MGAYQTFLRGSEQENVISNNARSIDDLSPRGLSLQRKARDANVRQLMVIDKEDQDFAYGIGGLERVKVGKKMVARLSLDDPDIKKRTTSF